MRIDHGEGELESGQSYVMTIKDQSVLDLNNSDEEDLNNQNSSVVLESTHLQSDFKRRIKEQRKTLLAAVGANRHLPTLDDEFGVDSKTILNKYDDVETVAREKRGTFILG